MIEVYLIGEFVAYLQLSAILCIEIGVALYAVGALPLARIAADVVLDTRFAWEEIERGSIPRATRRITQRLSRQAAARRRLSSPSRNSAIAPGPDRAVPVRPARASASGL